MDSYTNNSELLISSIEILCVGTELLMGQIVNTNASFLAKEMSLVGIPSYYQSVVGDNPARLEASILQALSRSDAVILTGGLGPTADDITMEIAARAVNKKLVIHEESVKVIRSIFEQYNRPMTPNNLKQAMLPESSIILPNNHGTAPGAIIEVWVDEFYSALYRTGDSDINSHIFHSIPQEHETASDKYTKKALIMLPGPPSEMRGMFATYVRPYLEKRAPIIIKSSFVRLFGIGESHAETKLKDLIDRQSNPTIAPYCSDGECMFRISDTRDRNAKDSSQNADVDLLIDTVKERLGEFVYEIGDRNMPNVVFDLLDSEGLTVSFAESCTAGMATSLLADIPGSSRVLKGSVVSYSNDVKESLLHVPSQVLFSHGAVSEQTALAMAKGCRQALKTDYSVSITGIAGPDGGTEDKPVGLVFICVCGPCNDKIKELQLRGSRSKIRYLASLNAFDLLRRSVLDDQRR